MPLNDRDRSGETRTQALPGANNWRTRVGALELLIPRIARGVSSPALRPLRTQ
jgi:hypothetical protein